MKVLVTGANGFIGREMCRRAVEAGHAVIGLARRGRPPGAGSWTGEMEWITGDVLEPAGWRAHLRGCGAVLHCVGIIREDARRGATFDRINGDSAITAAEEADGAGVGAFVFVSASAKPPLVGKGYIRGKRRAEARILDLGLRGVILRPGFVYGPARLPSLPAAALLSVAGALPIVGAAARHSRPVAAETLARAALCAAADESVRGILDVSAIERLGAENGN